MPDYSVGEAAAVLGVSPDTVRRWIDDGAKAPGFARTLSFQYHYLTGIKAALRDPS